MVSLRAITVSTLLMGTGAAAVAQDTYQYTGGPFGGWFVGSNWDPNGVPGVNMPGPYVLVENAPVSLSGGPRPTILSLSAPAGLYVDQGITVALNASVTGIDIRSTDQLQGFECYGTLTLSGNSLWRAGIVSCPDARQLGSLAINGAGGLGIAPTVRGAFRNQGSVTMIRGLNLESNASVVNAGVWDIGADISDHPGAAGGVFQNSASATHVAGNTTISTRLDSTGSISVSGGELRAQGVQTTLTGAVALSGDATLRVSQSSATGSMPPVLGCTVSGRGNFILWSGDFTVAAPMSVDLNLASPYGLSIETGGVVTLTAGLTNLGRGRFTAGRMAGGEPFVNMPGATLRWGSPGSSTAQLATVLANRGRIDLLGSPALDNGGEVRNETGGSISFTEGGLSTVIGSSPSVVNNGRIIKEAGPAGNTTLNAPLQMADGGTIEVYGSTLVVGRGSVWSGSTTIELAPAAARLQLGPGTHAATGGFITAAAGSGVLEVPGLSVFRIELMHNRLGSAAGSPGAFLVAGTVEINPPWGALINYGRLRLEGGTLVSHYDGLLHAAVVNNSEWTVSGGTLTGAAGNRGLLAVPGVLTLGLTGGPSGAITNFEEGLTALTGGSLVFLRGNSVFDNLGTVRKTGAGAATIGGGALAAFANPGRVEVLQGALQISAPVEEIAGSPPALLGGTWLVEPGATLSFAQSVTRIGSTCTVVGNTAGCPWLAGVTQVRGGELILNADAVLQSPLDILFGGHLEVREPARLTVPGGTANGVLLESILDEIEMVYSGSDQLEPRLATPMLDNHARLVPGGHGEPGPFNLTGDLVMRPTGRILVELGGLAAVAEHDRVAIIGSATLNGTLDLSLIDGFVPVLGQEFTVMTATAGLTGAFASLVQPPGMPDGLAFAVVQSAGSLAVHVVAAGCYPNCDGSTVPPVLNVNDFICFQQRYAGADPYANCDGSTAPPVLNVNDFVCFMQRYAAGCR